MKRLMFIAFSCAILIGTAARATTVKLKITYKGQGVANCDITIKHGDAALGSGRTDNSGSVSISASGLISKSIDVYGKKSTSNGTKTWNVNGWVVLDGSNYYHLVMDDVVKEVAEGSGMSESFWASAWGLTLTGSNTSSSSSSSSSSNTSSSSTSSSTTSTTSTNEDDDDDDFLTMKDAALMREDNLKARRDGLRNEIDVLNRKIVKRKAKLGELENDADASETEKRIAAIDVEDLELKRDKKEIQLAETNARIDKTDIPRDQQNKNNDRLAEIKVKRKALDDEKKELNKTKKAEQEEENFENYSKPQLKKKIADIKMKLKSKKLSLKMKGKMMKQDKKEALETEIAELETKLERYQKRVEELEAKE